MNRIDYNRALLLGVVLGMSLFSVFYIVSTPVNVEKPKPEPQRFEVVDNYKGCDVVRWENSMLAEYKYFLYCASSQGGTQISQMP